MNISTSFYIGTRPSKKTVSIYLPMQEKRAVIKETNFKALFQLEYYLSVFAKDNFVITDQKTATATGLPLRSVQDNRRLLERKNLYWDNKTTGNGMTNHFYCARKEGVYRMKYFNKLFGYNKVSDVYKYYKRKQFENILAKNSMTPMQIKDITDLLDRHHDKLSKKGQHRHDWSSVIFTN